MTLAEKVAFQKLAHSNIKKTIIIEPYADNHIWLFPALMMPKGGFVDFGYVLNQTRKDQKKLLPVLENWVDDHYGAILESSSCEPTPQIYTNRATYVGCHIHWILTAPNAKDVIQHFKKDFRV
jgi:hypothetical protein